MAIDFSNLLSDKFDDVKRPPVKPAGTYNAVIESYELGTSSKKGTPFCRFKFTQLSPGEDIDPEQLKDSEGKPIDLSKWKPTTRGLSDFYLTPDAKFRLKEFMESLQIPGTGRTLNEMLPETKGMPVLLTVSLQSSEDGETFFNNIDSVKAAV